MKRFFLGLVMVAAVINMTACGAKTAPAQDTTVFDNWEQVVSEGKGKEVTILMWGGNEGINRYMDGFIAEKLKDDYGITLKRVPMNPPEYLSKLLNEKKGGVNPGTADLLWINGENFRTARQGDLIWGPFTQLLPNFSKYYETDAPDMKQDTGIPIDGYEAVWGRAQLVITYDEAVTPNPPKSFEELEVWVKANPGKFTYPKLPDDFVGVAFIRTAFTELTGKDYTQEMTEQEFNAQADRVMAYFKGLSPYLWREGKAYPATQAQQDELFRNGEVAFTMGFEIGKTQGLVNQGVYPSTVKSYVFDTGTIGNSHYLAIPANGPEKAAALLVIDTLQSPEAQLEKFKAEIWGDMPAFEPAKLNDEQKALLKELDGTLSVETLAAHRLPEMKAQYIDWIKTSWIKNIGE